MNRSGSTWLFNAVRLLLSDAGTSDLAAGWVDDRAEILRHRTAVLKVHDYDPALLAADWPCAVLTSHRDPRDVVASMARKFGSEPTPALARHILEQYQRWSAHAVYDMKYESLIADPHGEIRRVAAALGLRGDQVDEERIASEIASLQNAAAPEAGTGFDRVSLLHEGHVTDGRHGSWRDQLPAEVAGEIEREFDNWMRDRGYLPETAGDVTGGR